MTRAVVTHGATLPNFALPAADGARVEAAETYRGRRNLVIVCAANRASEGPAARLLDGLAARKDELDGEAAQVITVVTTAAAARAAGRWPFPALIDEGARVHREIGATETGGAPVPAVLVTDRFREIYAGYVSADGSVLPGAQEIIDWLVFINIQCPECGAPEWPA